MTISELLKMSTEDMEAMSNADIEREFGGLVPQIRAPIEGMIKGSRDGSQAQVKESAAKRQDKQVRSDTSALMAQYAQMKAAGLLPPSNATPKPASDAKPRSFNRPSSN